MPLKNKVFIITYFLFFYLPNFVVFVVIVVNNRHCCLPEKNMKAKISYIYYFDKNNFNLIPCKRMA